MAGGLLGGIIPAITNIVPIVGMITGDSQGNMGGGIGDILGGKSVGGGGILGALGGSSGGALGATGLVGSVMDLLGVTDILGGFGIGDGMASNTENDADADGFGSKQLVGTPTGGGAAPSADGDAKPTGGAGLGSVVDALLGSLGGTGSGAGSAQQAAANVAPAIPAGHIPRLQPRASAGVAVGSSLPSAMDIAVLPMI